MPLPRAQADRDRARLRAREDRFPRIGKRALARVRDEAVRNLGHPFCLFKRAMDQPNACQRERNGDAHVPRNSGTRGASTARQEGVARRHHDRGKRHQASDASLGVSRVPVIVNGHPDWRSRLDDPDAAIQQCLADPRERTVVCLRCGQVSRNREAAVMTARRTRPASSPQPTGRFARPIVPDVTGWGSPLRLVGRPPMPWIKSRDRASREHGG